MQEAATELSGPAQSQPELLARLTALETAAHVRALTLAVFENAAARAADAEQGAAADEADARAAATSAANLKVKQPWPRTQGEFDARPQAPTPGETLPYFGCEEGQRALQSDPLLGDADAAACARQIPARPDTNAASVAFSTPGVYCDHTPMDQAAAREDSTAKEAHAVALDSSWPDLQWHEPAGLQGSGAVKTASLSPRSRSRHAVPARDARASPPRGPPSTLSPTRAAAAARGSDRLPRLYKQPRAAAELNLDTLQREYETLKLTNTASAAQVRARGRDGTEFILGCAALDFGGVRRGGAATRKVPLQNVSLGAARFSVDQVAPPLSVDYPHTAVPAGLRVPIAVRFQAPLEMAIGPWEGELVVRSTFNVLRCPVRARVVAADGECVDHGEMAQ